MTAQSSAAPASSATTAFDHRDFEDIYPRGVERHYWNRARNRIVYGLTRRFAAPEDAVLDVGCGPGLVTAYLRESGLDCRGCDLGTPAPGVDAVAPFLWLGMDACNLDPAFRTRVRVILMLDVLEHLESPRTMLARLRDAFSSLTHIVFTVPARMDLWSNYDERNRHFLRYDRKTVRSLAEPGRFELVESAYFFHALYPPARVMNLLGIKRRTRFIVPRRAWMHTLVASAFVAEHRILPGSIPGSSLYGVLRCIR